MLCGQAAPAGALEHIDFGELDRNGDNRLSSREAYRLQRMGFDFAVADRNRDGYISKPEFDSAVRVTLNA
jgi:hypothetical protein